MGVALVLSFVGEAASILAGEDVLIAVFLVAILILLGVVMKWGGSG